MNGLAAGSFDRPASLRRRRTARGVTAGLLVLALLLGACSSGNVIRHSTSELIEVTDSFVLPSPGGPSVVAVTERRYANAVRQEVALASNGRTPGQNSLSVTIFGPVDSSIANRLSNPPLLMTDISREMIEAFPGVAMQPASAYVQNKYGPFGYAIGRAGGDELCIYGWQRVRAPDFDSTLFSGQGTLSVRLRLCERGISEEELLAVMYGYTITASLDGAGWNPYGAPLGPDESLGRAGAPVFPVGQSGFVHVADPAEGQPASAREELRAAVVTAPATAAPPAPPPVVDVVVPPPPAAVLPTGSATGAPAAVDPAAPAGGRALVPPPPGPGETGSGGD